MHPSPFEYHRPATLPEAIRLLAAWRGDVRCLAGGQSLIPSMKLRLAQPAHLVDLSGIAALRGIDLKAGQLSIGAMTTHREVEASPLVQAHLAHLGEVAGNIADAQVRNRGTIGGSLANADPAADYPASLLALDGVVETHGVDGARSIAADDWSVALMETALKEGEILTRIRFPLLAAWEGAAYVKVPHPASRFATVGIAAKLRLDGLGVCVAVRIASTGVGEMAQRARGAEALLIGAPLDERTIALASDRLATEVGVVEDGLLSADAKRQLCRMTARKALGQALVAARQAAPPPA